MAAIFTLENITSLIKEIKKTGQKMVLAGGCFDILHPGHVVFLEKAKKAGDTLIVLLESDRKVRLLKGAGRPVYNQKDRAKILSALKAVDYVVMLPFMKDNSQYDELVTKIRPDVIAVTSKDFNIHQQRAAKLVGAKLKIVTKVIGNYSSTQLLTCS